jgi:7-carboxy-7-deazaguanine synthase
VIKIYTIKEIFHSVQGEGYHMGKAAIFVRFAGCNLWSGREQDRDKAICKFCDTDFVGGQRMTREEIVAECVKYPGMVIFTGGEPGLQLDHELVRALQRLNKFVAIETNGTLPIPQCLDWICVSPKANTKIVIRDADELKLVFPQHGMMPDMARSAVKAKHLWVSPKDGPYVEKNMEAAINYVKIDDRWRVNIQAHKFWKVR